MQKFEKTFETFSALLDFAENRIAAKTATCLSSRNGTQGFTHTKTFNDALALARNGWREGSNKINSLANVLIDRVSSMIETQTINYDVTGIDFDVAMVLQGIPECWSNFETIEGSSNRMIRLVFNCFVSAAIDPDVIIAKGATICALIIVLETYGIRVELDLVSATDNALITARVKNTDQPLDVDRLSFALTHPSMFRRIIFSVLESDYEFMKLHNWGYGSPREFNAPKSDLYIGASSSLDSMWDDQDSAIAWIMSQLKAQGVSVN